MNKCSFCQNTDNIIKSNNPLVKDICVDCLIENCDVTNVVEFAHFCRTYNIYWSPNVFTRILKMTSDPISIVVSYLDAIGNEKPGYVDSTDDLWKIVQDEWSKIKRHEEIKARVSTIRDGFLDRCRLKWGVNFTFEEYMTLENMYAKTINTYGIADPMKLDAVKKAVKISVLTDRAIEAGETKMIKELFSSQESALKVAGITELSQTASEGTIKTVADLYKYMERNGFEFKFHDGTPRDIVDFVINDIKKSIRNEIANATGLDTVLNNVKSVFEEKKEAEVEEDAIDKVSIEELESQYSEIEKEADDEYDKQDFDIDQLDEELEY